MRDYNQIKFRAPRSNGKQEAPEEEKKEAMLKDSVSVSTAPSTPPSVRGPEQRALSPSRLYNNNNNNNTNNNIPNPASLTAADALAVRREGAEATIIKLRAALDESSAKDSTAKTALAKSDAVILELRSSVRQLKRQLEKVQDEKALLTQDYKKALDKNKSGGHSHNGNNHNNNNTSPARSRSSEDNTATNTIDSRVGELQIQLDRAHAQILTADMVRKELEDTLEAEQYTWELRVQDQERQIAELQNDCATLVADLESVRSQWKEAEETWHKESEDLKQKLEKAEEDAKQWKEMQDADGKTNELREKIVTLEHERRELQGCLDEALKELEAVDAELQGDPTAQLRDENEKLQRRLKDSGPDTFEALQHLYRFVRERDGLEADTHTKPQTARDVIAAIQNHLDRSPVGDRNVAETHQRVKELEAQLSVFKGDLKAREESTAELRASLKEAVSLLKPLQDAVAKADRDKARLQQKIDTMELDAHSGTEFRRMKEDGIVKEKEIDRLKQEVETLEIQLTKARTMTASSLVSSQKAIDSSATPDSSGSRARARLRAKREEEQQLKQMLEDARNNFKNLRTQEEAAGGPNVVTPTGDEETKRYQRELEAKESAVRHLESNLKIAKNELSRKESEMSSLVKELEEARSSFRGISEEDHKVLKEAQFRVHDLERKLNTTVDELREKQENEKALNKSLKEALSLLRPLQMHLEEAEEEKRVLNQELSSLRRRIHEDPSSRGSAGDVDLNHMKDLEYAVSQLEKENSQLHEALEDMSQSISINASHVSGASQKTESRLKEEIVEIKSRYEVTHSRLQEAFMENEKLRDSLQKRDQQETDMAEELKILRQQLQIADQRGSR